MTHDYYKGDKRAIFTASSKARESNTFLMGSGNQDEEVIAA